MTLRLGIHCAAVGRWLEIDTITYALLLYLHDSRSAYQLATVIIPKAPQHIWRWCAEGAALYTAAHLADYAWLEMFAPRNDLLARTDAPIWVGRQAMTALVTRAFAERGLTERAAKLLPGLNASVASGYLYVGIFAMRCSLAIAATAAGDFGLAEEQRREAISHAEREGLEFSKANGQQWYAWMLAQRSALGDHDHARKLLTQA